MILDQNQGRFVYTLDDSYIHMAMAKNFSQHGVWGITPYAFTSCSSSLFWTAFLAVIFFITGPNELVPFIICLASAVMLIFLFYIYLKKEGMKNIYIVILLPVLLYLVNMTAYVFTGLEHTLHALVTVLFIIYTSRVISGQSSGRRDLWFMVILAFILPLLRYEGLVSIILLCVLLAMQRKFALFISVFLAGIVPVSLFGFISVLHGWSFFPNSMLNKWGSPDLRSISEFYVLGSSMTGKFFTPFIISFMIIFFALIIAGFYFFKKHRNKFSKTDLRNIVLVIFYLANAVLYYIFSMSVGSARYQHFLVVMAIFVASILLLNSIKSNGGNGNKKMKIATGLSGIVIIFTLIIFLEPPSYLTTTSIPRISTNIYEQHYQMGLFFKRYYQGKEIAINDIGTTGYLADVKMIDLWGLSDLEISKFKRTIISKNDLVYLAKTRNIKVAIIYERWFRADGNSIIPKEWIKAGEWKILNNIVCPYDRVAIYAVDISEKDNLIRNLRLNSPFMPPAVIQSGIYTEGAY